MIPQVWKDSDGLKETQRWFNFRGWDGWMASPSWWTWVWVTSGSWWWTGRPDVLRFMRSQRVGHDWATELNWSARSLHKPPASLWSSLVGDHLDFLEYFLSLHGDKFTHEWEPISARILNLAKLGKKQKTKNKKLSFSPQFKIYFPLLLIYLYNTFIVTIFIFHCYFTYVCVSK